MGRFLLWGLSALGISLGIRFPPLLPRTCVRMGSVTFGGSPLFSVGSSLLVGIRFWRGPRVSCFLIVSSRSFARARRLLMGMLGRLCAGVCLWRLIALLCRPPARAVGSLWSLLPLTSSGSARPGLTFVVIPNRPTFLSVVLVGPPRVFFPTSFPKWVASGKRFRFITISMAFGFILLSLGCPAILCRRTKTSRPTCHALPLWGRWIFLGGFRSVRSADFFGRQRVLRCGCDLLQKKSWTHLQKPERDVLNLVSSVTDQSWTRTVSSGSILTRTRSTT